MLTFKTRDHGHETEVDHIEDNKVRKTTKQNSQ